MSNVESGHSTCGTLLNGVEPGSIPLNKVPLYKNRDVKDNVLAVIVAFNTGNNK